MPLMNIERSGRGWPSGAMSGIRSAMATEVEQAYRRLGLRPDSRRSRAEWTMLVLRAQKTPKAA